MGFVLYGMAGHSGDDRRDGCKEGQVGHNHVLEADVASVMAATGGSGRFIPEKYREMGQQMALGGASAVTIDRVLRANAKKDGEVAQLSPGSAGGASAGLRRQASGV